VISRFLDYELLIHKNCYIYHFRKNTKKSNRHGLEKKAYEIKNELREKYNIKISTNQLTRMINVFIEEYAKFEPSNTR